MTPLVIPAYYINDNHRYRQGDAFTGIQLSANDDSTRLSEKKMMPFSVRYNSEFNAVETIFKGIINEADMQAQMLESCAIAAKYAASYAISNFTAATLRVSIVFIYDMPELCERMGGNRPVRLALINLNQENDEMIGFYQLVSQNRGWNVQIFSNTQQAKAWLLT
ncbi:hypothetical protein [Leptolyngbya sp. Heron Island J]|uniref:hypothetical protein n=1 Tax=Leptolyngbya sp. Heron Island J TaxID=1385935 RepID=UPI00126942EE|nr:hypothetical protein [Leptolyngbya sp. Heron Island J]